MSELKFCTKILESCIDILADIDEVAESLTNKIQKKIKTDFTKLTSTEEFDIVIKRMISIDQYVKYKKSLQLKFHSVLIDRSLKVLRDNVNSAV
ncbi:19868_t:CDS:2 [Dentiscutata erythropus]|uniref:19868_t:CDS:1 n=1 Tax=Dentiscutata erythropus TaxID=1348616 RepID=A0A9N9C485_9GLOM|nr:19868_t:CDS:2 [Dentiscutata erythropus]